MFPITIRNSKTGEEKSFSHQQDVANYFATSGKQEDWTGHEFTGPLPKPDPEFVRHYVEDQKRQAAEAAAHKGPGPKAPKPPKKPKKRTPSLPIKKVPAKKAARSWPTPAKKAAKAKRK